MRVDKTIEHALNPLRSESAVFLATPRCVRRKTHGHEIDEFGDAVGMEKAGD